MDVVAQVAKEHKVSAAEIALAWVRQRPGITSTIIGAKKMEQLKENIHSVDIQFSPDQLKRIEEVSALKTEYPEWMTAFQGGNRQAK